MDELVARAAAFVTVHGMWAGPIVGLLAFGESLAIIGIFIPATAVMLAIGGLVGTGTLDPVPIIGWAVGGAVLGDWISYSIGHRIGPSVYHRWPMNRHRSMVARTRLFFRKYGLVAVFLGRFLGPIRATIPLVAGVMAMAGRPFQIANVASAVVWVPLMFLPGVLAVRTAGVFSHITEMHLIGFGLAIVLLTFAAMAITSRVLGGNRRRQRRKARRKP
jgi:membrane protein DedA with SNARE-associated domain